MLRSLLTAIPIALVSMDPGIPIVPATEVEAFAYMDEGTLEVGGEYAFVIAVSLPSGSSASKSGSPAPFLQLDVPPSVQLLGRTLTTHKELSKNEFLHEPFERLLEEPEVSIPFKLIAEPKPGETIGINVLAYVKGEKPGGEFFFRRRLELPVIGDGEALVATEPRSDWGTDERLLQIGQKASSFTLPNADGKPVQLDQYLGKKNIIVTTYRAHW